MSSERGRARTLDERKRSAACHPSSARRTWRLRDSPLCPEQQNTHTLLRLCFCKFHAHLCLMHQPSHGGATSRLVSESSPQSICARSSPTRPHAQLIWVRHLLTHRSAPSLYPYLILHRFINNLFRSEVQKRRRSWRTCPFVAFPNKTQPPCFINKNSPVC